LDDCAVLPVAAAWWGLKPTASRPRQSPLARIAASERTLHEYAAIRNALQRHRPILFLFVSDDCPGRIGMFLSSGNNRKTPCPVFYQSTGQGVCGGSAAVLFGRKNRFGWRRRRSLPDDRRRRSLDLCHGLIPDFILVTRTTSQSYTDEKGQ